MKSIRALCFDLDGTLVNSGPDIVTAVNATRRQFAVAELSYYQVIECVGGGVQELMKGVMQDLTQDKWDAAGAYFVDYYARNLTVKTHIYDGITELLNQCSHLSMAICTNKPQDMSETVVAHFGWQTQFPIVVGAEAQFPAKPDPQGLLHICQQLNCAPHEVAMIGDSVVDIEVARAAGCKAVAVTWGFNTAETLQAARPDLLIHHPQDLLEALA